MVSSKSLRLLCRLTDAGQRTCEWWKDKYDNIPMTNADFDGDDDDGLGEDDDEDEDEGAGEEHQEPPPAYDSVFGAKKSNRKVKR